jgi:hypothetical protein
MRALLLLALLTPACADPDPALPASAGADLVTGTVVSADASPWAYDGDAVVVLDVEGERVEVRVSARYNLCEAPGVSIAGDLRPGDRVAVRGERLDDGSLRPCADARHVLRRVD